jgi:hypothetical protein
MSNMAVNESQEKEDYKNRALQMFKVESSVPSPSICFTTFDDFIPDGNNDDMSRHDMHLAGEEEEEEDVVFEWVNKRLCDAVQFWGRKSVRICKAKVFLGPSREGLTNRMTSQTVMEKLAWINDTVNENGIWPLIKTTLELLVTTNTIVVSGIWLGTSADMYRTSLVAPFQPVCSTDRREFSSAQDLEDYVLYDRPLCTQLTVIHREYTPLHQVISDRFPFASFLVKGVQCLLLEAREKETYLPVVKDRFEFLEMLAGDQVFSRYQHVHHESSSLEADMKKRNRIEMAETILQNWRIRGRATNICFGIVVKQETLVPCLLIVTTRPIGFLGKSSKVKVRLVSCFSHMFERDSVCQSDVFETLYSATLQQSTHEPVTLNEELDLEVATTSTSTSISPGDLQSTSATDRHTETKTNSASFSDPHSILQRLVSTKKGSKLLNNLEYFHVNVLR